MNDHAVEPTKQTIPLVEEYLTLGRRSVEMGRVRVNLATTTENARLSEPVRHEQVEIRRIVIGREVASAPSMREEEDGAVLVIPVLEEILVTERRIILKEEIRIRRVTTMEVIEKDVAVHSQAATIECMPCSQDGSNTEIRREGANGDNS